MDDATLRTFLAKRDAPCPACGYNLRGLASDVCPECRQRLELRVGLVEPQLAAYLTAVVALSAGVGFDLLLLGYLAVMVLTRTRGGSPPREEILFGVALPGAVLGVALGMLLARRRWFRTRSRQTRITIACACVLATLGNVVVFAAVVR